MPAANKQLDGSQAVSKTTMSERFQCVKTDSKWTDWQLDFAKKGE
jgi:hypothetical protein